MWSENHPIRPCPVEFVYFLINCHLFHHLSGVLIVPITITAAVADEIALCGIKSHRRSQWPSFRSLVSHLWWFKGLCGLDDHRLQGLAQNHVISKGTTRSSEIFQSHHTIIYEGYTLHIRKVEATSQESVERTPKFPSTKLAELVKTVMRRDFNHSTSPSPSELYELRYT